MIWAFLLFMVAAVILYILLPLISPAEMKDGGETAQQLQEARAQMQRLEADERSGKICAEAAARSREALEIRVLELLNRGEFWTPGRLRQAALYIVPAVLALGTVGIYTHVGAPNFQNSIKAQRGPDPVAGEGQSLETLVVQLEQTLASQETPDWQGYVLLGRSLMSLERFDEALDAYDKAVTYSGEDANVVAERQSARDYLAGPGRAPQLSPEAIEAMQAMTPDEQRAAIESMVEGLALRLENNPEDATGWARLIRARVVLGQTEQAKADLARARIELADTPDGIGILEPAIAELGLE